MSTSIDAYYRFRLDTMDVVYKYKARMFIRKMVCSDGALRAKHDGMLAGMVSVIKHGGVEWEIYK